jgi:hypothetical protein
MGNATLFPAIKNLMQEDEGQITGDSHYPPVPMGDTACRMVSAVVLATILGVVRSSHTAYLAQDFLPASDHT